MMTKIQPLLSLLPNKTRKSTPEFIWVDPEPVEWVNPYFTQIKSHDRMAIVEEKNPFPNKKKLSYRTPSRFRRKFFRERLTTTFKSSVHARSLGGHR